MSLTQAEAVFASIHEAALNDLLMAFLTDRRSQTSGSSTGRQRRLNQLNTPPKKRPKSAA